MNDADTLTFDRIAAAIEYIKIHFKNQPSLEEIAATANLSPFHFQRLFTEWAGVSPKKFLQYLSIGYAKSLLQKPGVTLFDAALETGLSGTGRLHDLFVKIESMTPGEYKEGGENLQICYSFSHTAFGPVMVASTTKGICYLVFHENEEAAVIGLQRQFPKASLRQESTVNHEAVHWIFNNNWNNPRHIKLHLKGSAFQLKVWEALLKIPVAGVSTYGQIAAAIESPKASRAVGTAVGSNPVAYLIPCHRVIQSSGQTGGYMWGPTRKAAMLGWEAAKASQQG